MTIKNRNIRTVLTALAVTTALPTMAGAQDADPSMTTAAPVDTTTPVTTAEPLATEPTTTVISDPLAPADIVDSAPAAEAAAASRAALPVFKQYRDTDNRFYFKLIDGEGKLLVQSHGFDSPKDAGQLIGVLKRSERADAMETPEINVLVPVDDVLAALAQLREAEA